MQKKDTIMTLFRGSPAKKESVLTSVTGAENSRVMVAVGLLSPPSNALLRFHGKGRITQRLFDHDASSHRPTREYSAKELSRKATMHLQTRRTHSGTNLDDVSRAKKILESAIAKDPSCVEALCNLGLLLHSWLNDGRGAAELYEKALASDPQHTDTLCNYAFLSLHSEPLNADKAEQLLLTCLEVDSKHVGALCNYGLLIEKKYQDKGAAEEIYRKALLLNPNHVQSLFNLANLLVGVEKLLEGMETYKRVLSVDPGHLDAMCNLAILQHRACHDHAAAEHYFSECLKLHPMHSLTLASYASLKLEQRDTEAAIQLYRK